MENCLELVEQSWKELGYRVRPLGRTVFVRTRAIPDKVGSLYLPTKHTKFYGKLPHMQNIEAVVMAAGPKAQDVRPGDRVTFQRLNFARLVKFQAEAEEFFGWVDSSQIIGHVEE